MVIVEITNKTLNECYALVAEAKALGELGIDFDFEYVPAEWEDSFTLKRSRYLKFYFYTEELALFFKLKND